MIYENIYHHLFGYAFGSYVDRFVAILAVKHDCVFGDDLDLNEISYVSEVFYSSLSLLPSSLPLILT